MHSSCATPKLLQLIAVLLLYSQCSAQVYNLSLAIEEGLPAGTIVGDIRAGLPDDIPNSGFFISESRDSYVFKDLEIDGDTGIITTAQVLDRESTDKYDFVAATLNGEVIMVHIVVRDVNDHSPVFTREIVLLNISEQSPNGTRFELEGAHDQDEGEYGTQGYRITDGATGELFKVEYRSGGESLFNLDLVLLGHLDRELRDLYTFTIEAFDGGIPHKTGTLQVQVHVLDENDNAPVFSQREYHTSIWENAPTSTTVCQVFATDLDLGQNGHVTYEINRRQSDPNELFSIDHSTGIISVNKPLDYETQPFHELIIRARDNGEQPEYSSALVVVKVRNINDNSPTINVMFLSESGAAEVSEGAGIGEYVARISVSDPDLGEADMVGVSLEGGDGKFSLKPSDGFLYSLCVEDKLDREEVDLYALKIVASDLGSPPLWSEQTLVIRVTDLNDCPPIFEKDEYILSISEDTFQGSIIFQVQAKDLDEGMNSVVHYSIVNSEQDHLIDIDPKSGLITTAVGLDHEREAEIQFSVLAVDSGFPPLSATTLIIVHVEDINDNQPVFEKQLYNVSVLEHTPIGTCFLQVTATDADSGEFSRVTYSLYLGPDGYDKHPLFLIHPNSGEICVSEDIDREAGLVNYDILVKAEDQGGLSTQTCVHIEVEDLNDNLPVFSPETYVTSISSRTQPGTELLNVIAADRDSGTYGQVSYELLSGDLSSLFSVDKATGVVYLASTLTQLGTGSIKLSVSARDGEGLSSVQPATVTVNIMSSAMEPSVFQRFRYAFSVPEDSPVGTPVGTVQASSPDNSLEALSYRISSGDPMGLFQVHPVSGLICTSRSLDHETQSYALLMLQSQAASSSVQSSAQVNVTIADVNDNLPVFPRDRDTIVVSESTAPGTALYIARAHDRDSGANGRVHYALRMEGSGNLTDGTFAVDPGLGTLSLNQSLSLGRQPEYTLQILAEDGGAPSLKATLTLTVTVERSVTVDALAFETLAYQVEIGEGAPRDSQVIQVRAHGRRPRPYPGLSYSLLPFSGTPPFGIDSESGWLFLSQSLDHEAVPLYRFGVQATAREGSSVHHATTTVTIIVLDENDNAPVFTRDAYFFTVQEGPAPQGLIGSVRATDRDSRKNAQLSYILLSDGKHFRVNSNTGEIINWVALDREEHTHHTLKVLVTDHGLPRLNATATVHILVTDINDNPPLFLHVPASKEINVQIWAGLPVGSVVTTMFAKDLDAGENGTVVFSLMSDELGLFEIDSKSGEIRTTGDISQQARTQYTLTVIATDNGPAPLEETAVVHLQVQPSEGVGVGSASQAFLLLSVREDCQPGTVIGSVGSPERLPGTLYSIAEGDGSLHFGIDRSSGDLYVIRELDHEATARYLLKVRVDNGGQRSNGSTSVFVSIGMEDVNDHTPWFADDVIIFGLEENQPEGAPVYTFNAKDGDGSWRNSDLRYTIAGGDGMEPPFRIDPRTGTLTAAGPLDRERTPSITFTVTATDQALQTSDRRSGTLTVHVFLLDLNDNAPAFVSSDSAHVLEDSELGSLVHRLVAKDGDLRENGLVTYTVLSGNEESLFALEESTGLLHLAAPLDYKSASAHVMVVQALDRGRPRLSSTQTLTVSILDVNDQAPVFERSVYNATVMENRDPGEPVIQVTASDEDSGENAAVRYTLLPGPGFELFCIGSHTGEISTTSQLDRERQQMFALRVLAQDSGIHPLSSTATVLCSVLDENDNDPEFMQPSFLIRVPENLPPGHLHMAQAADPDSGANGTVLYSIQGEDIDDFFTINTTSGLITTLKSLDREKRSNYTIIIKAQDQGPTPRSSTAPLHVLVLDENDHSPTFGQKSYQASIREGMPAGSEVIRLTATDSDEGPSGEVTFSLTDDTLGAFAVDGSSGVVRTTRPLDRETRSRYTFWASATDGGSRGPRSSVASVTVNVEDVNDNTPVCAHSPLSAPVAAEAAPNQTVATVRALDGDLGENGTVTFALSELDAVFEVSEGSGDVRVKTSLPSGFFGTRLLRVVVTDRGTPALSSTCLVLVHLRGQEEGLRFTESVYEAAIPENSKPGSWVANVIAEDQSLDEGRVEYSIFSGNEDGAFAIDAHNGDITVKEQSRLDFEEKRTVHLVVLADNGRQTAHCRVTISLHDVNDNPPSFEQHYYKTAVWEGQIPSTYVMQVFALDADSGLHGQVDYSILSGNHNNAFVIDSTRGILATNAVLDREIVPSYKLVLQAVDRGSPPLTGTSTIRIQVVDVNDNSPSIPPMEPVAIAENLPAGYVVTQVVANDVDLSSVVTYSFTEQGSGGGWFAIDPFTGVITLTKSLDREECSHYTLRVQASDSLHQTEAEVTIQVMDVNDNPPVFSMEAYQVVLPELSSADTFVLALSATDRDSGPNGRVSYRLLTSPLKSFYIHAENGSLFTSKPLTHVTNGNAIQLMVEARDGGNPPLTAVTSVEIYMRDANDHAPRFQRASYQVSVSEDTPQGSTLLLLRADDQDWAPDSSRVDYAITGGNQEQRFCLEAGVVQTETRQTTITRLVLCSMLDRETAESHALTVTATDRGSPPLNSSAAVTVTVLDVNDNAPEFSSSEYHAQVNEGSPPGTSLVRLSAHDPDEGQNAWVRYAIISGNGKGLFRMDPLMGTVEVNQSLDYEEDVRFTLTIRASDGNGDGSGGGNVAFAVLYISVLDDNDNSPYFPFPAVNCSVMENQPAFSPVCTVHAIDRDAGPYGRLTYSILGPCYLDYSSRSPDRKDAFAIDPLTGDIHTWQTFDYEQECEYCFLVEARDKGDQTTTTRVQVVIEGVDEFSPVFTRQQYLFHLPEFAKAGQSIGQVSATDHDTGQDGILEYALARSSPFFSINRTSGVVYLSAAVYRRQGIGAGGELVDFVVMASSPKMDSRLASCLVIVNISRSAEVPLGMSLSAQTISLSVSLVIVLLLLIAFIVLVLRFKRRETTTKKGTPPETSNLTHRLDAFDKTVVSHNASNGISLQDLRGLVDIQVKRRLANPYRHSDSSGRGSAEGETAEDEEIQMINEHLYRKSAGSTLSMGASWIPDSRVPQDSDPPSYWVEEDGMIEPVAMVTVETESSESLHNFREEGGGEEMLSQPLMRDGNRTSVGRYASQGEAQLGGTVGGSLISMACTEDELQGSYSWDYLLDWQPRFQPLVSVFSDIGQLSDEEVEPEQGRGRVLETHRTLQPPPLITSVARPGIRSVPPRMPPPRAVPNMTRTPYFPKYSYSPLARSTGLTPSSMTPSFSPALSLVNMRTPSASPVVSETGLSATPTRPIPHPSCIRDGEIQV
ncbi:protocadherin-23 [Conger conger]|uniref:protocadherin-23 n=1 Tax=Conger conger TaxID=82655 RepID=UPI002A5B0D9B|nr:protocadherin-23 [Conger conger]